MELTKILKNLFKSSDKTVSETNQSSSLSKNIGNTTAVCPYCNEKLEKMPKRKTKCSNCDNHIYKRTRPYDEAHIIIREDQIDAIEEEWAIKNGNHDIYLKEKDREKRIRDDMRERFGKEPADEDVEFRVLNDQAVEAEFEGQWGFARNFRLKMAKNLKKRGSLEKSLRLYFHVCFLDINGPNNRGGLQSHDSGKYPFFTPESGMLSPGIIKPMKKMISKLDLSKEDCKKGFIEVTIPIHQGTPTKLHPEKAWNSLRTELFN